MIRTGPTVESAAALAHTGQVVRVKTKGQTFFLECSATETPTQLIKRLSDLGHVAPDPFSAHFDMVPKKKQGGYLARLQRGPIPLVRSPRPPWKSRQPCAAPRSLQAPVRGASRVLRDTPASRQTNAGCNAVVVISTPQDDYKPIVQQQIGAEEILCYVQVSNPNTANINDQVRTAPLSFSDHTLFVPARPDARRPAGYHATTDHPYISSVTSTTT